MRFLWLDVLQNILGWCYFVSWTLSFYPQVWLNWRRRSVIGFSFDLLTFNIVGYVAYSVYNLGLYCSPAMKYQYFSLNPDGVLPVMLNDVFFALHALLVCCFLLIQTLIYERGDQRVSNTCRAIVGLVAIYCVGFAVACGQNLTTWLAFLYQLSYVKVLVTFLKYVPQATLNFRSKSTIGWSIGNVLLDFSGGVFSILQIFIVAYNEEDWSSVTGAMGKLGLGICTVGFDILFMVQHFILYRPSHSRASSADEKDTIQYTSLFTSDEITDGEFLSESVP